MTTSYSDTHELRNKIIKQLNHICRDEYGGNASSMAENAQVSQSKMSRLLHGKQEKIDPYLEVAADVADALSMDLSQITSNTPTQTDTSSHVVRTYEGVFVGTHNTDPMSDWPYDPLTIPPRVAHQLIGTPDPPDQIGLVEVQGESMYPEIQCGDWVLFSPADEVVDGGTFLIRLDGALLLKNLQRKAGNRIRIHCFNSEFEDDVIRRGKGGWVTDDHNEHSVEFEVVGRFLNTVQKKELFRSSQRVREAVQASRHANGNGVK